MKSNEFTHLNSAGESRMVDVSGKAVNLRTAQAEAWFVAPIHVIDAVRNQSVAKGDVLAVARVAGIQAAKKTSELIPLCHGLNLEACEVHFELANDRIRVIAEARLASKTGVEMEALTAASVASLTLYDMCKALSKGCTIEGIKLLSKTGGKSGDWYAESAS